MLDSVRIASTFRRPPKDTSGSDTDTLTTPRVRAESGGVKWDALRRRLVRARTTAPLFRTANFTQDFEGVVQQVLRTALEETEGQTLPQTSRGTETMSKKKTTKKKKKKKKTSKREDP
jgi:hypothetical protein